MTDKPVILVVDHEEHLLLACSEYLEREDFVVFACSSQKGALQILRDEAVELLLVEVPMPGTDSFELMAQARELHPNLAVVLLASFGSLDIAMEGLQKSADGMILKPFRSGELLQSVHRALHIREQRVEAAQLHALQPLFSVSETLVSETNVAQLQKRLVLEVGERLASTFSALYERKADGNWVCLGWYGPPLACEAVLKKILDTVPPDGLLLVAEGTSNYSQWRAEMEACGMAHLLFSAVNTGDEPMVLLASRAEGQSAFRQAEKETLRILSRQARLAQENARLHEAQRQHIQELEESRRALVRAEKLATAGRLTASIAHEINNPLQALNNLIELALHPDLPGDRRQEKLEMAREELDRLSGIVEGMLHLYRPRGLHRQLTNVNVVVERVLQLVEQQFLKAAIRVEMDLSDDLPPVLAVPEQLQQVLLNLLLNALEAMPDGGIVRVHTAPLPSIAGQAVEITVEDTGPGVPDGEEDRVFEPFFSMKEHGTGLGLTVSEGIITAHGGTLTLAKDRREGACFRITLPEGTTKGEPI